MSIFAGQNINMCPIGVSMSDLKVRKIDFQFTDDIALQWNPENPWWGNFVNYAALIAPPFERYVIRATRMAMEHISDDKILAEAEWFCHQEAQHSRHHLAHLAMLERKYPGLANTRIAIQASYDKLFETRDLEFHLAYAATLELMFGPFASFIIDNREPMFKGSDPRIASFWLWHLVEEFEHRHSAINVFNALIGSHWKRIKHFPAIVAHVNHIYQLSIQGFETCIPKSDWDAVGPVDTAKMFNGVKLTEKLKMLFNLSCTLLPFHDPDNVHEPEWVRQWFLDDQAGKNMALYYP